ncbi:helix-turn-helix domain-containing protein [Dactylosporangium sp. NPDC051484]|uniref:winged helix-turn-helix transcriptional regulator n=1 Tax=Dactylosporangium sp. NPDC051484 TaxID=3154942 RepID=UPI00344E1589
MQQEGTLHAPRHPQVTPSRSGDLFNPACPTRLLLDRVGSKWTTMAVLSLASVQGELRFTELKRQMAGISQKMLAQTLKSLERDGLVARRVATTTPPRVHYRLTDLGTSLVPPLLALREWAEQNMRQVQDNANAFDAVAPREGL